MEAKTLKKFVAKAIVLLSALYIFAAFTYLIYKYGLLSSISAVLGLIVFLRTLRWAMDNISG